MVLLYGVMLVRSLLEPIHIMQEKIVCMATFNDINANLPGPLPHTPPLFHQLKVLTIYDIFELQVGKFVYESMIYDIGPSHSIIKYNRVSEIHDHNTRYADHGNLFINTVRTNRFGLKGLMVESAKIWATIHNYIKSSKSKIIFNYKYKSLLIGTYL